MAGTSLICTQSLFHIQSLPDTGVYAPKVPFKETQFTQRPYLQLLRAAISGMQDQL